MRFNVEKIVFNESSSDLIRSLVVNNFPGWAFRYGKSSGQGKSIIDQVIFLDDERGKDFLKYISSQKLSSKDELFWILKLDEHALSHLRKSSERFSDIRVSYV